MAMASTSSFTLSSFAVPKSKSIPHSFSSSSLLKTAAPATASSISVDFASVKRFQGLSSRFVRNVAISSDVEQDEDVYDDRQFAPDLKLFVGNLPFSVDSAQLAGLFESAGNVEMVEVIYDKLSGRSRGFGFVTMSTVEEVEAAAQQFNGYDWEGRTLRVNAGPPPPRREGGFREGGFREGGFREGGFREGSSPRTPRGGSSFDSNHRIHVGNLAWGVDDLALRELFSDHGSVVEAKVIYDRESGRSRGFGFVTYNSSEEVNTAIDSLDGADLGGRQIRVTQAEARPPRRQF